MRLYRHKPDLDDLQKMRETRAKHYASMVNGLEQNLRKRNARWMELTAEDAIDLGCLAYGLEDSSVVTLDYFHRASDSLAKAWEFELPVAPSRFLLFLSIALIA